MEFVDLPSKSKESANEKSSIDIIVRFRELAAAVFNRSEYLSLTLDSIVIDTTVRIAPTASELKRERFR